MNIKIVSIIAIVIAILSSFFYTRYLSNKIDILEAENNNINNVIVELNKSINNLQDSYALSIEYIYELQEAKNLNVNELNKVRKELDNYDDSKEISPTLNHTINYVIDRLHKKSR